MALIDEVERILGNLAQEVEKEASVLVQFAANDWNALKEAFNAEKAVAITTDAPVANTKPKKLALVDAPADVSADTPASA